MAFTCKACLHFLYVTPLLLLALALFSGTIILGIIGIARASDSNPCIGENSNSTMCEELNTLNTPINGTEAPSPVVNVPDPNIFAYWLAGATGCGLLFAVVATFSLWALEDALWRIRKAPKPKPPPTPPADEMELQPQGESKNAPRSPSPQPEKKHMDVIDDHNLFEKIPSKLRRMNFGAVVALFLSCLFFILAVISMLWAIAIGVNHSRRDNRTVVSFVLVELLVAIAFPFFFFASGVIMANVVDFITLGQADARKALPRFLQSVKFESGNNFDYWVIEENFYFQLKKRTDRAEHGFCYSCYPNFATWVLVGIVSLSINLAVSYFADITLDMQVSVTSCDDDRIDRTFSCFNSGDLVFVDCENPGFNVTLIHCFKFYRFGVDTNLIQAMSTTFAFYLVTSALFGRVFLGLKVFLHLSQRKLWGALVIVVGVLLFILSIAVIAVWLAGYISPAQPELARLNVINLGQFVMVSLFVILIGFLMVSGTWAEKEKKQQ